MSKNPENEKFVEIFTDKIKQDKLDQRRTVPSKIDKAFINAVGQIADAAGVELQPSVKNLVEKYKPKEKEKTVERPDPKAKNEALQKFMDANEIPYESDDNKADLNEKIDAWVKAQSENKV